MALLVLVCAVGCGDDPRSDGPVIGGWEPPPCVVVRSPGVDFGTFELDDEGNLLDGPAEAEVAIGNECEGSLEIRQIVLDESMATIDEPCAHGLGNAPTRTLRPGGAVSHTEATAGPQ